LKLLKKNAVVGVAQDVVENLLEIKTVVDLENEEVLKDHLVEEEVKVVTEEEVLLEVAVIDQIEILAAIESLPGLEEKEEIDNLYYI
jgi:hypothetical protein